MIMRRKQRVPSGVGLGPLEGRVGPLERRSQGGSLKSGPVEGRSLEISPVVILPVDVPCSVACSVPLYNNELNFFLNC